MLDEERRLFYVAVDAGPQAARRHGRRRRRHRGTAVPVPQRAAARARSSSRSSTRRPGGCRCPRWSPTCGRPPRDPSRPEPLRRAAAGHLARLARAGRAGRATGELVRHHRPVRRRARVRRGRADHDLAVAGRDVHQLRAALAAGLRGGRAGGRPERVQHDGQGRSTPSPRWPARTTGSTRSTSPSGSTRSGTTWTSAAPGTPRSSASRPRRWSTGSWPGTATTRTRSSRWRSRSGSTSAGVVIKGRIDRAERDGGAAPSIIDIKTSSTAVPKDELARHPQLGVYQSR